MVSESPLLPNTTTADTKGVGAIYRSFPRLLSPTCSPALDTRCAALLAKDITPIGEMLPQKECKTL